MSRKAYIGSLTKIVNKITFLLSDKNNKNSVIDENKKLDVTVSHVRRITSELKESYTDETKVNKALEICTEEEFPVIQIRKSINSFLIENFPEEELITLNSRPSSETSNNIAASVPENLQSSLNVSQNSEIHAPSENSRVFYLSVNEWRRTTKFPNNLFEQTEEKAKRKLERLQWSFELEKQKIEKEVEGAKISLYAENLKASLDNLSVFSTESSIKDFNSNNSLEYPIKAFLKVISKSKSAPSNKTYIKNVYRTPSNRSDKDTEYTKNKSIQNRENFLDNMKETIDKLIDDLVEGEETVLGAQISSLTIYEVLRQEFDSKDLPPIELRHFDGNPAYWPEFIESFRSFHFKPSFKDSIQMRRLLSILEVKAKRSVESIGISGIFYATALKTLKLGFGKPIVIAHLKMKHLFKQPQIKNNDRTELRKFHQHLKGTNTCLLSIGYEFPLLLYDSL